MVLAAAVVLSVFLWEWLQTGPNGPESGSTTIRNLSFVTAGLIGLPLAIWRSLVSERQADAAHRQAETAQQDLLNERYQQGAEMLGSDALTVRLGGIYALQRLAAEHPSQYHIQIMQLLCAFACHSTSQQDRETESENLTNKISGLRIDVLAVVMAISSCHARQAKLESDAKFQLDLAGVNLSSGRLDGINLSGARLWGANLSGASLASVNLQSARLNGANLSAARLHSADLSDATLSSADLSDARLFGANLSRARLNRANLSNARLRRSTLMQAELWRANLAGASLADANLTSARFFSHNGRYPAIGLVQAQLDAAVADSKNPPKLNGVTDSETGQPLNWRGQSLDI